VLVARTIAQNLDEIGPDEGGVVKVGDHKVAVYRGAEHAFVHDPDRPVHRPDDAADAWHRTLAFLLD
jgi:dienelactone hydrolase